MLHKMFEADNMVVDPCNMVVDPWYGVLGGAVISAVRVRRVHDAKDAMQGKSLDADTREPTRDVDNGET